jgi:hypothetical protein
MEVEGWRGGPGGGAQCLLLLTGQSSQVFVCVGVGGGGVWVGRAFFTADHVIQFCCSAHW